MDRRQKKTRTAIFEGFVALLAKRDFNKISVGDIIERANVGRATFYAHFETKEFLLKELCQELFAHIFEAEIGSETAHAHFFDCDTQSSVFLHLFQHLKKNDNHILDLLASQNNNLFSEYFKADLKELVKSQREFFSEKKPERIPQEFWVNHISATFVETVKWWIENGMKETPQEITEYFLSVIG